MHLTLPLLVHLPDALGPLVEVARDLRAHLHVGLQLVQTVTGLVWGYL